jgi:hypothetical protein
MSLREDDPDLDLEAGLDEVSDDLKEELPNSSRQRHLFGLVSDLFVDPESLKETYTPGRRRRLPDSRARRSSHDNLRSLSR